MDKDLAALQEVRDKLKLARDARLIMEKATQQDCDRWAAAAAAAGRREAGRLAKMAVYETDMGVVAGKTMKNIFATEFTWEKIKDMKTAGMIAAGRQARDRRDRAPRGRRGGRRCPRRTRRRRRCSSASSRSRLAARSSSRRTRAPSSALARAAASCTRRLVRRARPRAASTGSRTSRSSRRTRSCATRWTSLILATGGRSLVEAAYSSGKPAIGVGSGNVPAYIHESADVASRGPRDRPRAGLRQRHDLLVRAVRRSCDKSIERHVLEEFKRRGAHLCSPEEIEAARVGRQEGRSAEPRHCRPVSARDRQDGGLHGPRRHARSCSARRRRSAPRRRSRSRSSRPSSRSTPSPAGARRARVLADPRTTAAWVTRPRSTRRTSSVILEFGEAMPTMAGSTVNSPSDAGRDRLHDEPVPVDDARLRHARREHSLREHRPPAPHQREASGLGERGHARRGRAPRARAPRAVPATRGCRGARQGRRGPARASRAHAPAPSYEKPAPRQRRREPPTAPRAARGTFEGAAPLTPADIEAIISRHKK